MLGSFQGIRKKQGPCFPETALVRLVALAPFSRERYRALMPGAGFPALRVQVDVAEEFGKRVRA